MPTVTEVAPDEMEIRIGEVPASGTATGTPNVVMVRLPVLSPPIVGLNATITAQAPLGPRDGPQVLVCEKSPEIEMPSTGSGVVPALVIVIV